MIQEILKILDDFGDSVISGVSKCGDCVICSYFTEYKYDKDTITFYTEGSGTFMFRLDHILSYDYYDDELIIKMKNSIIGLTKV